MKYVDVLSDIRDSFKAGKVFILYLYDYRIL